MKSTALLATALLIGPLLVLLPGCEGESPTAAIPRTEERMSDYALNQVYMVPIASDQEFEQASLKSQIDPLMNQYGEEEVLENIRFIANNHVNAQVRLAAVFSYQPYVTNDQFWDLAEQALTEPQLDELERLIQ